METRTPPKLTPGSGLAASKQARADYFANLPRRDRSPKVIEKAVEVPVEVVREVEVERIVYVDREVEVERVVHVEVPVEVEIPAFLRYDPAELRSQFVAAERKEWETHEQANDRLVLEHEGLMNKSRYTRLTEEETRRYRELTAGLALSLAG